MNLNRKLSIGVVLLCGICVFLQYDLISFAKYIIKQNIGNHKTSFQTFNDLLTQNYANRTVIKKLKKYCFRISFGSHNFDDLVNAGSSNPQQEHGYQNITRNKSTDDTKHRRKCNRFVIRTDFMGRLGNQMYQFAATIGLAYQYDAIPIISPSQPNRFSLKSYFDLPNTIVLKPDQVLNTIPCNKSFTSGNYDNCSDQFSKLGNVSVYGYVQSWKYFHQNENFIRHIFKFKPKYIKNATHFLNKVSKPDHQRVCIHVRRGDKILGKSIGRVVADVDYIQKAQRHFINKYTNVQFIVVSDDKPWCAKNLKNIIISPLKDPGAEMALMTLCDHVIMTIGTYGWWGAWLAGGETIYYKRVAKPGSRLEDHFPPNWVGMS